MSHGVCNAWCVTAGFALMDHMSQQEKVLWALKTDKGDGCDRVSRICGYFCGCGCAGWNLGEDSPSLIVRAAACGDNLGVWSSPT